MQAPATPCSARPAATALHDGATAGDACGGRELNGPAHGGRAREHREAHPGCAARFVGFGDFVAQPAGFKGQAVDAVVKRQLVGAGERSLVEADEEPIDLETEAHGGPGKGAGRADAVGRLDREAQTDLSADVLAGRDLRYAVERSQTGEAAFDAVAAVAGSTGASSARAAIARRAAASTSARTGLAGTRVARAARTPGVRRAAVAGPCVAVARSTRAAARQARAQRSARAGDGGARRGTAPALPRARAAAGACCSPGAAAASSAARADAAAAIVGAT